MSHIVLVFLELRRHGNWLLFSQRTKKSLRYWGRMDIYPQTMQKNSHREEPCRFKRIWHSGNIQNIGIKLSRYRQNAIN